MFDEFDVFDDADILEECLQPKCVPYFVVYTSPVTPDEVGDETNVWWVTIFVVTHLITGQKS